MKQFLSRFFIPVSFFCLKGCDQKKSDTPAINKTITTGSNTTTETIKDSVVVKMDPAVFVPKGYIIFEKIPGDLNKDGQDDLVLIIKDTDKNNIVNDEYKGQLDRNRRGIVILFNKDGRYEVAAKNIDCFTSENEDGGVYFAPELSIDIEKSNLVIQYGHGRYGDWSYTFRYNNNDFEMIGYDDSSSNGPVIVKQTSINFLTKKKLVKKNTNGDADSGEEVFSDTWTTIPDNPLIKLSQVRDFSELERYTW